MLFFISNMSVLINLQSKFSSPNGSVSQSLPFLFLFWHWMLLHFCHLCFKSVLPRLSAHHCPSSQELLKPKHGAICLRVSSVLLPSLDQTCACIFCSGKMSVCSCQKSSSNPEPATKRPQRKSVPTNRLQVGWISKVSHKHPKDCRQSTFF